MVYITFLVCQPDTLSHLENHVHRPHIVSQALHLAVPLNMKPIVGSESHSRQTSNSQAFPQAEAPCSSLAGAR